MIENSPTNWMKIIGYFLISGSAQLCSRHFCFKFEVIQLQSNIKPSFLSHHHRKKSKKALFNDVKTELRYWIFNLFHRREEFLLLLSFFHIVFLPLHWFEIKNSHQESSQWGLISSFIISMPLPLQSPPFPFLLQTEFYLINFIFPFINDFHENKKKCRNSICSNARIEKVMEKYYHFRLFFHAIKLKSFSRLSLSTQWFHWDLRWKKNWRFNCELEGGERNILRLNYTF